MNSYTLKHLPCIVFRVLLAIIIAGIFSSCDAPRQNPLDSENPDAVLGVFTGTVQTFSSPRKGLQDALVLFGTAVLAKTDANGNFSVNYAQPNNGWYYFQKSGYITDSLYLDWSGKKSLSVSVLLNQIPVMDSLVLYSSVRSGFTSAQTKYEMVIKAKITDKDGDIDSVFVYNAELALRSVLSYNIETKLFEASLNTSSLGVNSLSDAIGVPFSLLVKDQSGRVAEIGAGYLKRILSDPVPASYPSDLDTVSSTPQLKWNDISVTYPFTYTLQVYSADVFPQTLAWQKEKVTADSTYTVDTPLNAGTYSWIIWRVDNNSNRISSPPLSFNVK